MPEQNWHPAATKFISSFVKLLHILYTGQVEFSESIELVGHINVRIDHKYNFDYIVNEQVSKEGEDSGTVFHSNSYHACPSSKLERKTASPVELVQGIIFSKLHHNTHERLRHPGSSQDYLVQPQGFSTEDTLLDSNETSVNYSVTVGSSDKQEVEANQIKFKSEGESNSGDCLFLPTSLVSQTNQVAHMSKCQQPIQQGDSGVNATQPLLNSRLHGRAMKHKGIKQLLKKTSPVFTCREYLERYNSFYAKKKKHFNKQEMMRLFSDLAQKYGVAITIKPAKIIAPLTKTCDVITTATVSSTSLHCVGILGQERDTSSEIGQKDLQHSNEVCHLFRETKIGNISDVLISHLPSTPVTPNLQSGTNIITVISADTESVLCDHPASYSHGSQALLQVSEHGQDISNNIIILSDSLTSFPASELSSSLDPQNARRINAQETFSTYIPCAVQKSVQSAVKRLENSASKVTSKSTIKRSKASYFIDPDTPSSALLNAIAVALAEEESSSSSSTTLLSMQERLLQQPVPKMHKENFLVCLRKEDPERYEQYKCLSKKVQAQERRRISEANRDPDIIERKSLINRVLYFRKVNKLPPCLRDKSNDEIRNMSTEDLKKLLPLTKSLKNMDPFAKEEWYRLGRNREWRRRKKLLDPEGFKSYNNERAKRYQDNLKKNNPEKYKELRTKGADRLRQYRFSQKIMKAIKDGREINISDSVSSAKSKLRRFGDRKKEAVIEVREVEEELLIDENIDKTHVIPECATAHDEAATSRESSSTGTDHTVQPDILDLMYNY